MLNNDLVFMNLDYKSSDEFLKYISDELLKKGYVKENFKKAIMKREEEYPTAIKTEKYNLAIPHTDSKFVNKPGIAFVNFKSRCHFKEMCTDNDIDVDMAFILLVTDKDKQVVLLSKLMTLFSNNKFLENLHDENNISKIVELINNEII